VSEQQPLTLVTDLTKHFNCFVMAMDRPICRSQSADHAATFRSLPRRPLGDILVSNKTMCKY